MFNSHKWSMVTILKHRADYRTCLFSQKFNQIALHAKSLQSCPTLCDPMDKTQQVSLSMWFFFFFFCPWGSSGKNIGVSFHALLQWSSQPGMKPASLTSPALAGGFFTTSTTWEAPDSTITEQDRALSMLLHRRKKAKKKYFDNTFYLHLKLIQIIVLRPVSNWTEERNEKITSNIKQSW